jgi:hypothetical protein
VVMDNLNAHKGERVRELVEEAGCELLYLPTYSPDLNPIEDAFAKIKAILRKAGARSREALIETLSEAISAVSAQQARGFFEHAGYRSERRLLPGTCCSARQHPKNAASTLVRAPRDVDSREWSAYLRRHSVLLCIRRRSPQRSPEPVRGGLYARVRSHL